MQLITDLHIVSTEKKTQLPTPTAVPSKVKDIDRVSFSIASAVFENEIAKNIRYFKHFYIPVVKIRVKKNVFDNIPY